jgi:gamma-glutamyl-gamma-aminobutyrate hydrolase PuuD
LKKLVGIIPSANLFETEDIYSDRYYFINNYAKRVYKNSGIPIGILADDGYVFEESLEKVDSILVCGGKKILPHQFQAVEYAIENNKKILGICLGMQLIHIYFLVCDEAIRRNYTGSKLELFEQMKKEKYMFTAPVEHHWDVHMIRGKEDDTKHVIKIKHDTHLHNLLKTDTVKGASMHHYKINNPSPRLTISAYAEDGTPEAIEYGKNILGVQFHPEIDDNFASLFKFLTE